MNNIFFSCHKIVIVSRSDFVFLCVCFFSTRSFSDSSRSASKQPSQTLLLSFFFFFTSFGLLLMERRTREKQLDQDNDGINIHTILGRDDEELPTHHPPPLRAQRAAGDVG